jgi:hypothetical protein
MSRSGRYRVAHQSAFGPTRTNPLGILARHLVKRFNGKTLKLLSREALMRVLPSSGERVKGLHRDMFKGQTSSAFDERFAERSKGVLAGAAGDSP